MWKCDYAYEGCTCLLAISTIAWTTLRHWYLMTKSIIGNFTNSIMEVKKIKLNDYFCFPTSGQ